MMPIGPELQTIIGQLRVAYPEARVPDGDYWPLLVVLKEGGMSDENLSKVVAEVIDGELVVIDNDIAKALTSHQPRRADVERIRRRLRLAGWEPVFVTDDNGPCP